MRAGEESASVRLRFLGLATACRLLTRKAKPGYWLRRLRETRRAAGGGGNA